MSPLASRMSVMSGEGALSVFARAKELEREGRSIIHLELGEPDFHPAAPVLDAAKLALDQGKDRYCPVQGVPALRAELATYLNRTRKLNVHPDNIVIAPGCKIALFMAMMALVEPGDEVLYPDPGFPGYASITLGVGGVPVPFSLAERNRLQPDPDEIYARIIYGGEYASMMRCPGMEERTLIIDGFSKSFAMTGWRLGYTVAPSHIVSALNMLTMNSYTCVAEFTQYAAVEALRDGPGATPRMVAEFGKRREQFARDLNRVPGFRCAPPEGAFYAWVNIADTGLSAEEICRMMLEEAGVAAIPGAAFGSSGKDFVRFSFASSTATLKEAVERILKVSSAWQGAAA